MTLAHDALNIVFKLHAGFLQSYEIDEHKRLLRSAAIVQEGLELVFEFDSTWDHEPSTEAITAESDALTLTQQIVETLLRLASNYVAKPMRRIPHSIFEAYDTLSTFRDEIDIRMANTQHDRVLKVVSMFGDFYASETRPSDRMMSRLHNQIIYTLQDVDLVDYELDVDIVDWLHETFQDLLSMARNT